MQTEKKQTRVGPLQNLGQVLRELGRLYRAARRGDIETSDASKLASVLSIMRQCLEASDVEQRMALLEKALAEPNNVVPLKRVG
jgi:hypothetical protein